MMAAVKPFTYFLNETQPPPKSGFLKPNEIHGSASTSGEEQSNPEIQNNELSPRDFTSAYRSFEADLNQQTDSEYERKQQQTAYSLNSQLTSFKAPHEKTVPAVPPKPPNDQTDHQHPTDKSSTDWTVGGVARERLNGGQSKERRPNPDDSDDDEHLYGKVKRHKESKTERENMTPKRIPYEIPTPFSYTDPIRQAAAPPPPLSHGERQATSVDENKQLDFDDVVIDDFSDLCSSLSSISDDNRDQHLFVSSAPPVVPSKPTEWREEEFTSDDSTKRPKLPEISDASLLNSRKAPTTMPNSMVAAKPFTYLTGGIPFSKSEVLRSGDEIDDGNVIIGSKLSLSEVNASPRPIRNPITSEKDADLTQRMVPTVQYDDLSHQPADVYLQPKAEYCVEQKSVSDYALNQQKTNDLQTRLNLAASHVKKVPIVPPKRANDQTEQRPTDDDSSCFLRFTSKESLFGDRQNNGQTDRFKKDGQGGSDHSENNQLLYGQVNRNVRGDVKTDKDKDSTPSSVANEIPPPFSYTEPIRPTAPLHAEKQYPSNEKGKKSEFEGGAAVGDFDDLCPSPPNDVQTLFDNFILVKATPSPEKTRHKQQELPPKEPPKRLKLLELFDPPPPPPPSVIDPRKFPILGVTSTESSDFHIDNKSKVIANGGNNYDRMKGPVSTFDNPDYNISSNYADPRNNAHAVVDFRSDSNRSLVASNSTDKTSETPVQVSTQRRRCCDSRLCIAILVTALVTSVVCLGAGFVAGWFGRGMRDFGHP